MTRHIMPRRLAGFTLIELLIVVAIMLLLASIALPTLKRTLDDSKVREASRQLNAFFAQAKARAASTGRPCGVLMRAELVPGAKFRQVRQLFLAEVPAPYAGDTIGASIFLLRDNMGNLVTTDPTSFSDIATSNLPNSFVYDPNGNPRTWYQFDVFNSQNPSLPILLTTAPPSYEPFSIKFNYRGGLYDGVCYNGQVYLVWMPERTDVPPPAVLTGAPPPNFQVFRRPHSIGSPRELPTGTAIDLGGSGMGLGNSAGNDYGVSTGTLGSGNMCGGLEFGVGILGTSQWVDNGASSLVVLFNPGGGVRSVSINNVNLQANGTLHFLIGRTERVGATDTLGAATTPFYLDNSDPRRTANIYDPTALWVSVGRRTGTVMTADNLPAVVNFPPPVSGDAPLVQYKFLRACREEATRHATTGGQ